MSFRLFILYCAVFAGGGAFAGWVIGRFSGWVLGKLSEVLAQGVLQNGLVAMLLGVGVALALGLVDALWLFSLRQFMAVGVRVGTAVLVGGVAGLFGGLVSKMFYDLLGFHFLIEWFIIVSSWTVTGLLIGASVGVYDLVITTLRGKDNRAAFRKVVNGMIGGAVGGLLGGILTIVLRQMIGAVFPGKPPDQLWLPTMLGYVVLGVCIGLLVGLAQVILKEAWLKVESGFRAGRELLLSKAEVTIGRAESCDIGLFGDAQIEKLHARIQQVGQAYYVVDNGSSSGTYVNDQRISGPHPLRAGDAIRVGRCVLRFGERQKSSK